MIRILLCCLALLTSLLMFGCNNGEPNTPADNETIKNAGKVPVSSGPAPANNRTKLAPPGV
jgi:hypothetical protein